ncbi:MAG: hypothetical protein R3E79_39510 [Caldilineaceae bacterium]
MATEADQPVHMRELITVTPLEIAGKVIEPVVRLEGWCFAANAHNGQGGGGGALARLSPAFIEVRDGDQTYTVPVSDPTQSTLRTLLAISGAVSALCLLIMGLTALATRRR